MLHRSALILVIAGLISTGCNAQAPTHEPIQLIPEHDVVGWAESLRFKVKIHFDLNRSGLKYDLVASQFITTCESNTGLRRQVMPQRGTSPGLPPGTHSLLDFPFNQDETYYASLLELGDWRCVQAANLQVVDAAGQHSTIELHSNEARLKVAKPSAADEAVIKESGLWEYYEKGIVDRISPLYSISPAINAHPDSHYYCRFWVEELHKDLDGSKNNWAFLPIITVPEGETYWFPIPSKYSQALDNLEKYNCRDATPADIAYWRADNSFSYLKDFSAAQAYARKGLKLNPDPGQRAYFVKLLRFHSEADYLKQFKNVNRVPPTGTH